MLKVCIIGYLSYNHNTCLKDKFQIKCMRCTLIKKATFYDISLWYNVQVAETARKWARSVAIAT